MRDPNRIGPLLALVERAWRANPELRLGQLIGNCASSPADAYFTEDARLADRIMALYAPPVEPMDLRPTVEKFEDSLPNVYTQKEPGYPNTGHGHVWPRPDGVKARCGGPAICSQCSREAAGVK